MLQETSPVSQNTSVGDVKALVLSFHPVIVIETVEEERARSLLYAVAGQLRMTFLNGR